MLMNLLSNKKIIMKTLLYTYTYSKDTDQPAHPTIKAIFVISMNDIISLVWLSEAAIYTFGGFLGILVTFTTWNHSGHRETPCWTQRP